MILLTVTPMMLPTGMTPHILQANMTIPLMTSRMRHISMTLPMVSGEKESQDLEVIPFGQKEKEKEKASQLRKVANLEVLL